MKQHTIIFVPHARAKFRKWRLSTLQASLIIGALVTATLGGLLATILYFDTSFDKDELVRIQSENDELRAVNQRFETSIRDMEGRLTDYQQRIHQLAIVAGVTELSPSGEPGIGGLDPRFQRPELDTAEPAINANMGLLDTQIDSLDGELATLEESLNARQLRLSSMPTIAPSRGIYTSGFGYRKDPFTGRRAFHQGIDISAPRGREVVAPGNAIVVKAGRASGYGKVVYLSHGFGITTRFGHLSTIDVEVGQRVKRGELVGRIGSTGRSTGNHLHYEVRVEGRAENPLGYILDGVSP
ncbi:MAG: M23 family metallopeptidase [Acidobacteriota bacterium]